VFTKHWRQVDVIALIKVPIIPFVIRLGLRFSLGRLLPPFAGFAPFGLSRSRFRLFPLAREGGTHGKRECIVIFLQAPDALANNGPFQNTGHGNHFVGLH
jgi:hypothetical protein